MDCPEYITSTEEAAIDACAKTLDYVLKFLPKEMHIPLLLYLVKKKSCPISCEAAAMLLEYEKPSS